MSKDLSRNKIESVETTASLGSDNTILLELKSCLKTFR
jgi:hypothetical protein